MLYCPPLLGIATYFCDTVGMAGPPAVTAPPAAWQRLAEVVRARREELGLTQAEAVSRSGGGISLAVWSILENARQTNDTMRRKQLRAASGALGWPADTLEAVLGGGDPPHLSLVPSERYGDLHKLEALAEQMQDMVADLVNADGARGYSQDALQGLRSTLDRLRVQLADRDSLVAGIQAANPSAAAFAPQIVDEVAKGLDELLAVLDQEFPRR